MRDVFVDSLMQLAANDKNVILITGDLGFGVLQPFWDAYPDQFINAGIAEQAMTGFAAGLALEGKTVFTYSIGNFPTLRCLEQIRNDCAYHDANVKIICVGGGFTYGSLGMSHHATEDVAIMRALPGVTVFTPSDPSETRRCMQLLYKTPGTCYLRMGRGGEALLHSEPLHFQVGEALRIWQSDERRTKIPLLGRTAYLAAGPIAGEALAAAKILEQHTVSSAVYTFPTVKPLDITTIIRLARECDRIVTVEEHNTLGGFGSAIAEVLASVAGNRAVLIRIGLEDVYSSTVGNQDYLRHRYGLSAEKIVMSVMGAESQPLANGTNG